MNLRPADEIAELLLQPVLEDLAPGSGDEVLLFVNSMGGTPLLELFVLYRRAEELLRERSLAG